MNFRNVFFSSVRYANDISTGIALNLYKNFGDMAIFSMLVLHINKHGIISYFLISSLISFFQSTEIFVHRFLIFLLDRFISISFFGCYFERRSYSNFCLTEFVACGQECYSFLSFAFFIQHITEFGN